jgi:hypothetical protein
LTWIQTHKGRAFDLLEPKIADVDFDEIAEALSKLCRFNGHTQTFYSVAEHSCRVADAMPAGWRAYGLLHDAHEAYIGDWSTPLKQALPLSSGSPHHVGIVNVAITYMQDRIDEVIFIAAGLAWPMPAGAHEAVKTADLALLATERRDLMSPSQRPWEVNAKPLREIIRPWRSSKAANEFRMRLDKLLCASRRAA